MSRNGNLLKWNKKYHEKFSEIQKSFQWKDLFSLICFIKKIVDIFLSKHLPVQSQ